jgi:L-lactate dehydrogenase complex protein LldG
MNSPPNMPSGTREKILECVRSATKSVAQRPNDLAAAYSALPRGYVRKGRLSEDERLALMVHRLREYDAEVVECASNEVPAAIAGLLASSKRHTFIVPARLPATWLTPGFEWMIDRDFIASEIELADGVVTAAFCGVADSGTIVLHHSTTEARRALTLLPDWHLCVLCSSQVVETLPEYFALCEKSPALATYISGPSATVDIEMTRIRGVHGPRFLKVILMRDERQLRTG